jgi:hypothetical protein
MLAKVEQPHEALDRPARAAPRPSAGQAPAQRRSELEVADVDREGEDPVGVGAVAHDVQEVGASSGLLTPRKSSSTSSQG